MNQYRERSRNESIDQGQADDVENKVYLETED